MTPKEKAEELIGKYYSKRNDNNGLFMLYQASKQCALIAVDEIIDAIDWHEYEFPNKEVDYWQQVKNEIEKL